MVHFWFYFAAQFLFDFHLKLALKQYTIYLSINQSFGEQGELQGYLQNKGCYF